MIKKDKTTVMKIIEAIIKTILCMVFVSFCSMVLAFFIAIFNADGVRTAFEIFKGLTG